MSKWINVKEKLPETSQEVLVYWYDAPYEVDQMHILNFFKKGDLIDTFMDYDFSSKEQFLKALIHPDNAIIAPEDGFYILEENGPRKRADIITHWMPLPETPVL